MDKNVDLQEVARLAPAAVVHELTQALGAQMVATIADIRETRRVREWERGEPSQRIDSLRAALQATRVIVMTASAETAKAWFVSCCSRLDSISPLEKIREDTPEARTAVVRAAASFAFQ